jgi:ubiquinone/menaquinone biosynthesis C-methylase UbiE
MPLEIEKIVENYYKNFYAKIHGDSNLSKADNTFHKLLEKPHGASVKFDSVLEIGSGNYEHMKFVRHDFGSYTCVDLRTPNREAPENLKHKLSFVRADATELPFADESFDRVLSTCLLMHLNTPVQALEEWERVLKFGGILEFMVPCEPGFALTLFQRRFSEKNAEANGVNAKTYRLINAYDHVSSFPRLKTISEAIFKENLDIDYFPFSYLKTYNLNAFGIFRYKKEPSV